ncbi:hypothetical protein [Pseudoalteromonas luteoviolacea]|nr:hypothetical protein [Pseudoalteromonas luteoviolacea]
MKKVSVPTYLIETASGSFYKAIGKGQEAIVEFKDFELLRNRNSGGKLH